MSGRQTLSEVRFYCQVPEYVQKRMDKIYEQIKEAMMEKLLETDVILEGIFREDERIIIRWLSEIHDVRTTSTMTFDGKVGIYLSWGRRYPLQGKC